MHNIVMPDIEGMITDFVIIRACIFTDFHLKLYLAIITVIFTKSIRCCSSTIMHFFQAKIEILTGFFKTVFLTLIRALHSITTLPQQLHVTIPYGEAPRCDNDGLIINPQSCT